MVACRLPPVVCRLSPVACRLSSLYERALADGLAWMLDHPIEGVIFETFSVTEHDVLGSDVTHDLKPGGRSVGVTDANKAEYVRLAVDWYTRRRAEQQICALVAGFHEVMHEVMRFEGTLSQLWRLLTRSPITDSHTSRGTCAMATFDGRLPDLAAV